MTRFPCHDGISWHPRSVIDRYSPGQVEWTRYHHPGETGLTGEMLRRMCPRPEDGQVFDQGNGVTLAGTANLALVLAGAGGYPLVPGRAAFGVGSDAAEFDREHVHLANASGEEPGRSWYRMMDAGYPRVTRTGVIEGQATFTESEACFEWHEWCWATGPRRPEAHHALHGAYGGEQPVMMNRRAHPAGYGMKEPGCAWVFRAEVTIGLHTSVSLTG